MQGEKLVFAQYFFAISCGILVTFGFAPWHLISFLLIAIFLFLHLILIQRAKVSAFFVGFAFGSGHFGSSLYWIVNALAVDFENFKYLIYILQIIVIPAIGGILFGALSLTTWIFQKYFTRITAILCFPFIWIIFEILRYSALLDFQWNMIGMTGIFSLKFIQNIKTLGVYGMGLVILFWPCSLLSKNLSIILATYLITVLLFINGHFIINNKIDQKCSSIELYLLHTNISASDLYHSKAHSHSTVKFLEEYAEHSNQSTKALAIFPEGVFPYKLTTQSLWQHELQQKLIGSNKMILLGVDRISNEKKIYNSMLLIDEHNIQIYDKKFLVPFGEYAPNFYFLQYLHIMKKQFEGNGFSKGRRENQMTLNNNYKFMPLICYEATKNYSNFKIKNTNLSFVSNITNDSWFGDSIGIHQHCAISRIRAIEYDIPLVRVANSGISYVTDRMGRIMKISGEKNEKILNFKFSICEMKS